MISSHPDLETLTRFVRGTLGRLPSREIEVHLAGCPACREKLEAIPPAPGPEAVVKWRAHLFEERRRQREQGEESRRNVDQTMRGIGNLIGAVAEKQILQLLAASEHERRLLIRQEESFRTLALCELLEARCRAAWFVDPEEAAELARLAVQVAERLDPGVYGAERVENARSMAWMHLGNAFRIAAEWRQIQENVAEVAEPSGALEPPQSLTDPALPRYEIDTALWEMRDAFLERGMGFDAVLVTLDLAADYLREERVSDIRRMVEESVPLFEERFEERGLQPYTVDAVRFLRDAIHGGEPRLTPDLLARMATLLQRARNDPQNRWKS